MKEIDIKGMVFEHPDIYGLSKQVELCKPLVKGFLNQHNLSLMKFVHEYIDKYGQLKWNNTMYIAAYTLLTEQILEEGNYELIKDHLRDSIKVGTAYIPNHQTE